MDIVTRKPLFLVSTRLDTKHPGAGCSKVTASLVNVSLKFKTLILQIHCYFLLEKCENDSHIFPTKNNSVFDNVVSIYLTR